MCSKICAPAPLSECDKSFLIIFTTGLLLTFFFFIRCTHTHTFKSGLKTTKHALKCTCFSCFFGEVVVYIVKYRFPIIFHSEAMKNSASTLSNHRLAQNLFRVNFKFSVWCPPCCQQPSKSVITPCSKPCYAELASHC